MNASAEWIATHALLLWTLSMVLAIAVGDRAWQRSARWRRDAAASAQPHVVLRWHTAVLLLATMLLLFGGIALAIDTPQPGELALFDASLAESLHTHLPLPVLRWIAVLTHLGDLLWVAPATALIALILLLRRHWRLAGAWVLTLIGSVPINSGLKALFRRARPPHDHGFIVEHGWSFPSGHAFGAIVFYGMLAYVLLRLLPLRFHRVVIAATVACVGLIGISRILLQVHYFSDVLAGFASGAAWLLVCISVAERLRAQAPRIASSTADDAERKRADATHRK